MAVKIACLVPHPPVLIPEVGGAEIERISATKKAMNDLAEEIAGRPPMTFVFVSPHSPAFADAFAIKTRRTLQGSMSRFGAPDVAFCPENDIELAAMVLSKAQSANIPVCEFGEALAEQGYSDQLDHGVLVPLYYLKEAFHGVMISVSISGLSYFKHYLLGRAIQEAADEMGRDIALMASGDMSHRLTSSAPAGYHESGKDFDKLIREIMQRGSFEDLFEIDETLIKDAGECGFRSILVLAGALNSYAVETKVLSYEGPFGVGYMVATARPIRKERERDMVERIEAALAAQKEKSLSDESAPVSLAREAVEEYVQEGCVINAPGDLPAFLLEESGAAFICLKKDGLLRGCIGTTAATEPNLAGEIIKNAVHAATRDPRFPPVEPDELADLCYTVDILEKPERISDESLLDPREYGVIVESGLRRGLLLPDIEGVDQVKQQVEIAKQKAGIAPNEEVKLYRFKVARYH